MSEEKEIDLSKSDWKIDHSTTSEIIYHSICENYGKEAVDGVLKYLNIVASDLSLGDNQKIILKILNGNL